MRKRITITLLLLFSLISNQILTAAAFVQSQDVIGSHDKKYALDTLSNDCPEHLSDQQSPEKCAQHVTCHCPAMSVSCGSSVLLENNTGVMLPASSTLYFTPIQFDALHSRTLAVELRPPILTS